jgi:hypothetical protein
MDDDQRPQYDEMAVYLKGLADRWRESPPRTPEAYIDKNYDALKLVGAGNATGMILLSAFITSGTRAESAVNAGKVCFFVFALGVATFVVAYFFLYHWSHQMDRARLRLMQKKDLEDKEFNRQIRVAAKSYYEAGRWAAISIGCFCVSYLMVVIAVLILH